MVPEGWKLSVIGDHVDLLTGYAFKSKEYTGGEEDVFLLRGDNVAQGYIRWRDAKKWPHRRIDGLEKYLLQKGDFVIAMDRTWIPSGVKVSEVTESDLPCLLVQRVSRLRSNASLEQELIKQYFSSHRFEQYVKKVQTETAVPHISPTDIREFSILVPSLTEQKKIAKILSTWDRAIEKTEKLIINSQRQKKSLMQQLLTGKKRFIGFNDEWKTVRLDELYTFKKGKGLSKGLTSKNGINKCILYGELYTKYKEVIHQVYSRTDSTEGLLSVGGDVLIPSSTTTSGIDLANATALLDSNVHLGGDINVLRPLNNNVNANFMAHLLTHIKKHEIASRAQGITIIHLYGSDLKGLIISLPDTLKEQQKIDALLSATDKEFEILQQKLDCLKQEKKALMQQLLTGKRRVIIDKEVA
jgi:type I restriction enzyme S subunit